MKPAKRAHLEAHGWAVGNAQSFLGLGDEERAYIDLKLALADRRPEPRIERGPSRIDAEHDDLDHGTV